MSRLNIYINLYFEDIIFKYIILNNLVTFSGEDKYRFKLYSNKFIF